MCPSSSWTARGLLVLRFDPRRNGLARLLAQLEPHGTGGLLLDHSGAGENMVAVRDIAHPQGHQIASAQLAVDGQVAQPLAELQPDADRPDFLELQRWLLTNQSPLVPRRMANGIAGLNA